MNNDFAKMDNGDYQKFFLEVERLYLNQNYSEIISIVDDHPEIDFFNKLKDHYCEYSEAVSVSYIELGLWQEALERINEYLSHLRGKPDYDVDDLDTFYQLKVDVYGFMKKPLKQLNSIEDYFKAGGVNSNIILKKEEIEEEIFIKYVKINSFVFYMAMSLIAFSLVRWFYQGGLFLSTLTTFLIIWYVINYLFHKQVKKWFILCIDLRRKLMR